MITELYLHDARAEGYQIKPYQIIVNDGTYLVNVFTQIASISIGHGGIGQLSILCHGSAGHLTLGSEGVNRRNVKQYGEIIRNKIGRIVIYACGVAKGAENNKNSMDNGREFCRDLAVSSNSEVIASNASQHYRPYPMDFGKWEGVPFFFSPDGTVKGWGVFKVR